MAIHDDYLDLLKYPQVEILTEDACYQYINNIQMTRMKNDCSHDIIDYDRLLYIKWLLKNDEHIQTIIAELEEEIAINYIRKQKILNKFQLQHHMAWDEDIRNLRRYPSNNEYANEVYKQGKKNNT